MLQWATQQGCPWDERTCSSAARGGHLAVLQWARQHGCPWDKMTCFVAARGGHLAVLQWARQHGCPWKRRLCVQWAHDTCRDWIAAQPAMPGDAPLDEEEEWDDFEEWE